MAGQRTPATTLLDHFDVPYVLHRYEVDPTGPAYGEQVIAALDVAAERVFKTLVVIADGALCVGVIPVRASLDFKRLATALGAKRAAMAAQSDAERSSGYVRGGISPLGQRRALPTVLDTSAGGLETFFVSGGRRGVELELSPYDVQRLTKATFAPIAAD